MTRWSPVRVGTGLVLGSWAGLFWFLLATGRTSLFLSSRTSWLVPAGAVLLTAAAAGRLVSARIERPDRLARREAWVLGAIALPVVVLTAMPPVTLGTYAVGRRASFVGSGVGDSVRVVTGPLDFIDVAAAQSFDDAAKVLATRAGERITLEGIVTLDPALSPDEFFLTRFIVTCCTADATIAQVRVVGAPPGAFAQDDWVRVTGSVFPIGRDVIVVNEGAEPIPAPEVPYLTP